MDILPSEMIYEIFNYLNFMHRIICKEWKMIIESSRYFKYHVKRIKFAKEFMMKNKNLMSEKLKAMDILTKKILSEQNNMKYDHITENILLNLYDGYIMDNKHNISKKINYYTSNVFFIVKSIREKIQEKIDQKVKQWNLPFEIIYKDISKIIIRKDGIILYYILYYDPKKPTFIVGNYTHNIDELENYCNEEPEFYRYIGHFREISKLVEIL